jgi:hypothetical protein
MSKIALDIALIPPKGIIKEIEKIVNKADEKGQAEHLMSEKDFIPHISLSMGCTEEDNIPEITEKIKSISKEFDPMKIVLIDLENFESSEGKKTHWFSIKKNEKLQELHERIMDEVEGFLSYEPTPEMYFKKEGEEVSTVSKGIPMFKDFGFERVHFKDETITLNRKWAMELFGEIEKADLGMAYKAKSRINGLDQELLDQMMAAGVDTIHTGIESVSQRTLDGMAKKVDTGVIRSAFDLMLDSGCQVNPVYMLGWIGETQEDMAENAEFIREMGTRQGVITYVSFITPHPGSNLTKMMQDGLVVLSSDLSRYTHKQPVAVPRSLGSEGLQAMVDTYHIIGEVTNMGFVNPRVDPVYLAEISHANEIAGNINPENTENSYTKLTVSAA